MPRPGTGRPPGLFETIVCDSPALLRLEAGLGADARAVILDSRLLLSTSESGQRAGYDGARRKRASKVQATGDTLGHHPALYVTPATVIDRAAVGRLAEAVQQATGDNVDVAFVEQGYTGQRLAAAQEVGFRTPHHYSGTMPRKWSRICRQSVPYCWDA